MAKKIYDIKPPKVARKIEKELKEFLEKPQGSSKSKKTRGSPKKKNHTIWLPVSVGILLIILVVGVYLFFKLPKAEIVIWPKVDVLSFKQTITADKSIDSVDAEKKVVPAQYLHTTKTNSQDFPATGNADNTGLASGVITIYNKYDPVSPFTFKAGTHFMSDSGKLFIAPGKIVIPAAKKSGSKITPGSVEVKIQAVEGGTSYNIAPSNFSVPGLTGTAYYYSVYATSTSAMAGGYAGKVKKVTADDLFEAKDVLTQKTTSDAIIALKEQISSDYILLDTAVFSNVTDASTKTKSGAVAESFNYNVTVEASALAFKKSDLDQFAKNYIISQVQDGETMLDSNFIIDYSASKIDVSGGKATINLDFSSGVYKAIDRNSMTRSLLGKNADQIKETINSILGDQIPQIQISFWPFWVTSAPNNQKAVNIELMFQ